MHYLRELWEQLDRAAMLGFALRIAAVFLALTVHELCHGLAAYALGDTTAKRQHRLSLNPLRHIDWMGFAALLLCGFGWAKPVPVDPRYFRHEKSGMALTALAGPAGNFLLALVLLFFVRFADQSHLATTLLAYFAYSTAQLSVGLGVFNLVPFPPLDGSKVLAALLPERLYHQWMRYESVGIAVVFALVFFGVLDGFLSKLFSAVFTMLWNFVCLL